MTLQISQHCTLKHCADFLIKCKQVVLLLSFPLSHWNCFAKHIAENMIDIREYLSPKMLYFLHARPCSS